MKLYKLAGLTPTRNPKNSGALVDNTRTVGIEIEVENVNPQVLAEQSQDVWEVTHDHSLRPPERSAEMRSPTPGYRGSDLVHSISELASYDALKRSTFGWRTGTHLHVDVRDKSTEDVSKICVAYMLTEPFIFAWEGHGRHESRFCMPWWVCSDDVLQAYKACIASTPNQFHSAVSPFSKYTSLNLAPLMRQGTVEFRHAQGTIDAAKLLEYINIALSICRVNESWGGSAAEMIQLFCKVGPDEWMHTMYGPAVAEHLCRYELDHPPVTDDILNAAINAALSFVTLPLGARMTTTNYVDPQSINDLLYGRM